MDNLAVVSLNHELAYDSKRNAIKSKILERIGELKLVVESYRGNSEFILLISNLAEFLCKKKYGIDKKELVIEILNELFNLNTAERNTIQKNIQFLWNNGSIKNVSAFRLFCCSVKEYFIGKKK